MLYGLFELSLMSYIIVTLVLTQITIAAVTLYLHRCQAHKAVNLHPVISHFFRFWLWLTTGMVTKEWVAIHRKHHAKVETAEDPHSPQIYGIKKVLTQGAELYREAAKDKAMLQRYGAGTPDDWLEHNLYSRYPMGGIIAMLAINLLCLGIPGITIWAIQMLWIPFWAAGVINGIGHYWGYRNSQSPDTSRNISPWGFFVGGEELHNNHHAYPQSAKFSIKPWEFDIGWLYLTLFRWIGLAKVNNRAPQLQRGPQRTKLDMDALKAVFSSRFEVLYSYQNEVIKPTLRRERRKATIKGRKALRKAKALLNRYEGLIDEHGKEQIKQAIEQSHALEIVVQYRQKLQAIWQRTSSNPKELLEALQDWCKQAEATGIDALQKFAQELRGYSVKFA